MNPTQGLIDEIYRERVLRARLTPIEQKVLAGAELFESACQVTCAGIRFEMTRLAPSIHIDPQMSFETVTMTRRYHAIGAHRVFCDEDGLRVFATSSDRFVCRVCSVVGTVVLVLFVAFGPGVLDINTSHGHAVHSSLLDNPYVSGDGGSSTGEDGWTQALGGLVDLAVQAESKTKRVDTPPGFSRDKSDRCEAQRADGNEVS